MDEVHSHLNSIDANIKFTIEIESEGSIAFLDKKQPDKTMAQSPCLSTGKPLTPTTTLIFNHTTIPSINTWLYTPSWIVQRIFHPPRRKHYEKLSM